MPGDPDGGVRSVMRAIDMLDLFDERNLRYTTRELVERTGLAKTTVLRLVGTLEQRGLLWTGPDGRIAAGPGLLRWARLAHAVWQVPEAARAVMRELVADTAETVNLYVRADAVRVCVAQEEGPQRLRHVVNTGDEMVLWGGAASKVLLIGADDATLLRVAAASPYGPAHVDRLRAQVRDAGERGHAVSHGEREHGASGVAAPVFGRTGQTPVAALAVGGPTARFTDAAVRGFTGSVVRAARRISEIGLDPTGGAPAAPFPGEPR
ncbi:DNA-binding transcriptional regulator, IclR family [Nocardiopsis flavescens]|uniref:DNA-binding transcriptional regulator, IclR family n=1 Tax=Nocardiopsis flavescens TaxID=758803 RepID=A0A1M6C4K9_9ACTN|nr:IclR family transcriptional regulator [Nocardiopsis flavescens]SHI55883.1 DNA-binding transcriptional regulator, IclR family [Nocardiopsis flavescens]